MFPSGEEMRKAFRKLFRAACIAPIVLYRKLISPALPPTCIYEPSCSSYAIEAITRHGLLKGMILSLTRLFRCIGVLFTGGRDEVPEVFTCSAISDGYRRFFKFRKETDQ